MQTDCLFQSTAHQMTAEFIAVCPGIALQTTQRKMMNVNEFISPCSMESFRAKQQFRVTRQAGNKPIMTLHVSH